MEKYKNDRIRIDGVEGIEEVVIGTAIRYIDNYAFSKCKKLKKLAIGENVEEISKHAFGRVARESEVDEYDHRYDRSQSVVSESRGTGQRRG